MIRFENVSKRYPGAKRPALSDISLEILRGEFVFLIGASGSGKSSCLRLILREGRPTTGDLHVLGQDLRTISTRKVPYFRRNIGVVFQDFRLLQRKTVFENVAFTLQVLGKSRGFVHAAVPDVLEMVGLAGKEDRLPQELSGGEQQRVAIARAVVNKPQILLADEPTGNLDPTTSAGIMAVLQRINTGGTTVVMATHEVSIVDKMQRRVVELVSGRIVRDERHGGYTTSVTTIPTAARNIAPSVRTTAPGVPTAAAPTVPATAPAPATTPTVPALAPAARAPEPGGVAVTAARQTTEPAARTAAVDIEAPQAGSPVPAAIRRPVGEAAAREALPARNDAPPSRGDLLPETAAPEPLGHEEAPPATSRTDAGIAAEGTSAQQPVRAQDADPAIPPDAERALRRRASAVDEVGLDALGLGGTSLAERLGLRASDDEQKVGPAE
jgi:cell division transport system ATP-binding protein